VSWSPELDREVCKMVEGGKSREAIARVMSKKLGHPVSKNAIIGRLNRIGMVKPRKPKEAPKPKSPNRYYHIAKKAPRTLLEAVNEIAGNPGGCQYIHGDAKDRDFCGKQTVRTGSGVWCRDHAQVVYERVVRDFRKKTEAP